MRMEGLVFTLSSEWTCSRANTDWLSSPPQGLAMCPGCVPGSHCATRGECSRGRRIGVAGSRQSRYAHQSGWACQAQGALPMPMRPGTGKATLVTGGAIYGLGPTWGTSGSSLIMCFLFLSPFLPCSPALSLLSTSLP